MRLALTLPLSLLAVILLRPALGDPLEAYTRAQSAESTLDADLVTNLWAEARNEALAAGNGHLALISGYRHALLLHNLQHTSDALRAVEDTLAGYDQAAATGERWAFSHDSRRLRTELLFLHDRCLSGAGRVADGWAALRQAASAIRHRPGLSQADAPDPLTARSFDGWTSNERALAWRTIAREAEYLDLTGRTLDALALLDRTAPRAAADEASADEYERSYADKVALNRTLLLDFLGWSERALTEQKALMERLHRRGRDRSYWVARLNYLRNLAQWEGPSADTLAAAREAAIHLRPRGGGRTRADQMVARMERDLARTEESRDQLRADADHFREAGYEEGAQWADRDALVAEAEDTNPPGLDPQFAHLLAQLRLRGQKRGEPTLYRQYALYLVRQERPDEAIPLFLEAIRLTRSFGWSLHLPALHTALASAHLDAGNPEAAAAVWADLDRLLAEIPDLPAVRRVHTETARALHLARLGRLEAARLTLTQAQSLAASAGLPRFQQPTLTEAELVAASASAPQTTRTPKAVPATTTTTDLQPLTIRSEGPADLTLRARFVLTNTSGHPVTGLLQADGPGLRWPRDPASESFVIEATGGPTTTASQPLTLDPGEQIVLATTAAAGVEGEVHLDWRTGDVRQSARWSLGRSDAHREDAVLNASALRRNGFYVQSVTHQITRAEATADTLAFRLRASDPVRLEYYQDGRLIGVDAHGDGDFSQPGDMLPPARAARTAHGAPTAAPLAAFTPDEQETEIEVYFFNTSATPPAPSEVTLEAEVFTENAWQPFARDVLQNPSR